MKTEENSITTEPPAQAATSAASEPSTLCSGALRRPDPSGNPQPSTQAGPSRQRNGAIARLPKATRRRINEMLDDGTSYLQIIAALGDEGKGLNEDIMTRWKTGGYQDHLREQRLLEQCRTRQLASLELLAQNSSLNSFQATQQLASAQICQVLAEFGPEMFRDAVTASPHNLFRMLNTFARLTNGGLKCERHLADEALRKEQLALEASPKKHKKGMSKKSIREMKDRLSLM